MARPNVSLIPESSIGCGDMPRVAPLSVEPGLVGARLHHQFYSQRSLGIELDKVE